ncbi:hypothetical protein C8R43DRAFT_1236415 [Mycena crocata]|nr:hypothetical protein C8R43DRAFT_1236415 [Mycena crocata]
MVIENGLNGVSDRKLQIHFAVIGAGATGLSCAIALQRIGHRVTVIEKKQDMTDVEPGRGVRMPPNLTKILFHWGLQDQLRDISVKSEAIQILLGTTGELMGTQHWDEELLRETRGEYRFAHLSDLIKLLYDEAIRQGAEFHLGTTALSIDPKEGTIVTDSAGVLQADVIVGADGIGGLSRQILLQEEHIGKPADRQSMWMYSATIPKQNILDNPVIKSLYDEVHTTYFLWFGPEWSVSGYPVGGVDEFCVIIYGPYTPEFSLEEGLGEKLHETEPRLNNILPLFTSIRRHPVIASEALEDWVSDSGRLLIIGSAAHPIPPGSIQENAMGIEDGAVLARLFSHLRTRDQISQFLWAFQEIRQPRCAAATESETNIMHYSCMPRGEAQEARDQGFRAKIAAGVEVLQAGADQEELPVWREVKEIFGYDAEDAADDWYVGWGSLKLRSPRSAAMNFPSVQVKQTIGN